MESKYRNTQESIAFVHKLQYSWTTLVVKRMHVVFRCVEATRNSFMKLIPRIWLNEELLRVAHLP